MKTILVATDFSAAAHNASLYAVELARAFNARIILFNAFQQAPVPVSEIPVYGTSGFRKRSFEGWPLTQIRS